MRKLELKGVYEAYTNSDLTEGRGGHVHIGFFTHQRDALKAVKGKGVMGTDADVKQVTRVFEIFDTYEEYLASHWSGVRERALSKLTREEREALNLPQGTQ